MCASIRRLVVWVALLGLIPVAGWACGGGFSNGEYVDESWFPREQLPGDDLAEGCFDYSIIRHWTADRIDPRWDESVDWVPTGALTREQVERNELGDAYAQVEAMRASEDDDLAWAAGEGLSPGVRHYTAGARAFNTGRFDRAGDHFTQVLGLPLEQQQGRGPWAQFMLGRVALAQARTAVDNPQQLRAQIAAAIQAFTEVRSSTGDDPMQLVKGSYGEEAAAAMLVRDYRRAAELYEMQAQLGDGMASSARMSLWILAHQLLGNEEDLQSAMSDPLLQRLVTAYLYTVHYADSGQGRSYASGGVLERYFRAIEKRDGQVVVGADQFAAAAYRIGSFDLATRLVQHSDSPLATWVRAKLAERRGDDVAAEQHYVAASTDFSDNLDWQFTDAGLPVSAVVDADLAALLAQHGRIQEAIDRLRGSGNFWDRMAGLAEHRLSLAELKTYVDQVPTEDARWNRSRLRELRQLLGRRLLRAGRFADAPAYFWGELQGAATRYAEAMLKIPEQSGVTRAQSRFMVAQVLREYGWDLLRPYPQIDAFRGLDYRHRRMAAALANQAADDLPPRSQAFAAVLCTATEWLLAKEPEAARVYYRRYIRQGGAMAWADKFGQVCPEPDFAAAAALRKKPG